MFIRGGDQTRKALSGLPFAGRRVALLGGGPGHHPAATTPPAARRPRLTLSHRIIACVKGEEGVNKVLSNAVLNEEGTSAGVGSNHACAALTSGSEPNAQRVYGALPGFRLGTTILRSLCVFPLTNNLPFSELGFVDIGHGCENMPTRR